MFKYVSLLALVFAMGYVCAEDVKPVKEEAKPAKEEAKPAKKEKARLYARGPEEEKFKTELALTDEQLAKVKAAIAAVIQKNDETMQQKEVAAAEVEFEKAKQAAKAAEKKLEDLKKFDLRDELRKAAVENVPADKKEAAAEIVNYKLEKPKAAKPEEKKTDAPKADAPKADAPKADAKKADEKKN